MLYTLFAACAAAALTAIVLVSMEMRKPLRFRIVGIKRAHVESTVYVAYASRYGVLWFRVEQGPEGESEDGRGLLEDTNIETVRKEVVRRVGEARTGLSEIRTVVGEWDARA